MTPPTQTASCKPVSPAVAASLISGLRIILGLRAQQRAKPAQPGGGEHHADFGRGYIDALLSPG